MNNVADFYPLSPMQEGMLFHTLLAPGTGVYVTQASCRLQGGLNLEAFEQTWQQIMKRHTALRTCFVWEELERPIQVVQKQVDLAIEHHDWRDLSPSEQGDRLRSLIQSHRIDGFTLSESPLMRLALAALASDAYYFVWTWHHLLLDGWSVRILMDEFLTIYAARCEGRTVRLGRARPFRDYIAWLQQQDLEQAEEFWRSMLKGFSAPTPLAIERTPDTAVSPEEGYSNQQVELSKSVAVAIQQFARRSKLTLNTVMQGVWALLLGRYSGEEDVVFGSAVSGRPADLPGVELMIGLFINTILVRVRISQEATVEAWLKQLQAEQVKARKYEYSPLVQVQGWSEVPRGLPLFESILVFENFLMEAPAAEPDPGQDHGLRMDMPGNFEQSNLPLTLTVSAGSTMIVNIGYDRRRFEPDAIARVLDHFRTLLEAIVVDPLQKIADLSLLAEAERLRLLVEFNDTRADYPAHLCLHELFEEQVRRAPSAIALSFEGRDITYEDLNRRANQLAHYLRRLGVGPEVKVGISVERTPEMVAGLLGILKAGGAYVPLDPSYPKERLEYMLGDSRATMLVASKRLLERFSGHNVRAICLEEEGPAIAEESDQNPRSGVTGDNLAYVIYTSGSTGKPKGVQIEHRKVVNFLSAMRREPGLRESDAMLAVTTVSFDIAALEIFLPLAVGGRVIVASGEVASDGVRLAAELKESGALIMQATPATWRMLLEAGWQGNGRLKILCGGEALGRDLAKELLERGAEVWNLYGPTEATIWTTVYKLDGGSGAVSIGRPISNTTAYVLDRQLRPAPVGVPGDLYIGGEGLARGYLNQPAATGEKFIPDPFSQVPGARLYQTGDRARFLPSGNIEFLGRIDHQVKVRGFRIEPAEVEAAIEQYPGARKSVVVASDVSGDKRLVAYVACDEQRPAVEEIRSFLKDKLPDYMVPSLFIMLSDLPLTPAGKVDRRALPAPDLTRPELVKPFVAPRDAIELELASIWEEILGTSPVGVTDNFFDLGGHSLLAVRLMGRIQKQFGKKLPLATLIQEGTIEQLAGTLRQQDEQLAWTPLVAIQGNGTKRPFFCVHPIGGHVLCYVDLSKRLGEDQPFYGLQAPDLIESSEDEVTIEAMAAHYLNAIRAVQPRGPFQIGGWSFGGVVAFEMAQQLRAQGEEVALLALLDTWKPINGPELPDDATLLVELALERARQDGKELSLTPDDIRPLGADEQLGSVLAQLKELEVIPPEIDVEWGRRFLNGYKARRFAVQTYEALEYSGKITLFRSTETEAVTLESIEQAGVDIYDPTRGWGELCSQPLDIHTVPGYHEMICSEPYVRVLAERMGESIEKASGLGAEITRSVAS